jgi:hypothetical protein
MTRTSPTLRRRRLSAELRKIRGSRVKKETEAGGPIKTTAEWVDTQLGWSKGKLARMERGDWLRPNPRDIQDILTLFGITDDAYRAELITLARQGRERGWWHPYKSALSEVYETYIGLEAEAASVHTFQLAVVPGLLQIAEYARELSTRGPHEISEIEVARQVEVRVARQELLTRTDDPLRLWAIIDEGALRRPVGSPDVMRAQLEHMLELAQLAKVTLQVVPSSVGGHPGTLGSFSLLEFPHPDDPEAVYIETIAGELFIEELPEVKGYQIAFQRLTAYALTPADSLRLIADLVKE